VIPQELAVTEIASESQEENFVAQPLSLNVTEKEDATDSVFVEHLFRRKSELVAILMASLVVAPKPELAPLSKSVPTLFFFHPPWCVPLNIF